MPSSAPSRIATTYDTAYMTPAVLDWSVSGNPPIGTAFGAPPPSYSFDGSTATRMQSSVPTAFEHDSSISSPSSLGTLASATSFTTASANPSFGVASGAPPRPFDGSTATRMQSSVPTAFEHDRSIFSPSSLGTPASVVYLSSHLTDHDTGAVVYLSSHLTDHDTGAVVYLSSQPDRSRHRRGRVLIEPPDRSRHWRRRVLIEPTHVLIEPTPIDHRALRKLCARRITTEYDWRCLQLSNTLSPYFSLIGCVSHWDYLAYGTALHTVITCATAPPSSSFSIRLDRSAALHVPRLPVVDFEGAYAPLRPSAVT